MQATEDRLLDYDEATAYLGVTRGAITNAVSRGRLHPVKFPNSRRKFFRMSDLIAYRTGNETAQAQAQEWEPPSPLPPVFRAVLDGISKTSQDNLASLHKAAQDNFINTSAAMVTAALKLAGIGDSDPKEMARFIEAMKHEMETRIRNLMEDTAPILMRMQHSTTPDDLNDLENIITAFLRKTARDLGTDPDLSAAGEQFMQVAFSSLRNSVSRLPEYTVPALPHGDH